MKIKMTSRRSLTALVAGASALSLAALPASAATHKAVHHAKKVTGTINVGVGYPLQADGYPLYYGIAKGIFKHYGINIVSTNLTPAAGVGALYSGSIDILFDGTGVVNEAIQTHKVKAIGTYSEVPVWFVAQPSSHFKPINKLSDLAEFNGKTIGASTPGSLVTDVEQNLISKAHSTAKFDFLGASSPIVALQHGLVDTIAATPATLPVAKADGMVVLGGINKLVNGRGLYTLVGGNNTYVAHHKALLREFNMAYHVALKDANRNVSSLLPVLESSLNVNQGQAQQSYTLQKKYEFLKAIPNSEVRNDLNNVAAVLPAAAHTKTSVVVDDSALFG